MIFLLLLNNQRLSVRTDSDPQPFTSTKKQGFHVNIDPWRLTKSKDKASIAAEKAREQVVKQKQPTEEDSLKPLLLETKCGPLMTSTDKGTTTTVGSGFTLLISKGWMPGSPGGKFSSSRRWVPSSLTMFSGIVPSPKHKYRNNFDLKFMEVSRKLETYISRQVLCSVTQKEGSEASPR